MQTNSVPRPLHPSKQLVFIDDQAHEPAALKSALGAALGSATTPSGRPVSLAGPHNAVQQMAAHLQGHEGLRAIHLVSHGQPGALMLGGRLHDQASLAEQADAWRAIGAALAPGGDLLLYGCEVAQGESGRHFVQALARLTGAHVAASARPTGAAALGGDAALEVHTGPVATTPLLAQADYDRAGVRLATLPGSIATSTGSWFHTEPLASTTLAGSVDSTTEVDYYRFAVESSGTHTFTLTPAAGLDVQFRLYDQTGAALTLVRDQFGSGTAEVLSVSLTAGQWVYLGVAGFGSTMGAYTFNLLSAAPTITAMNTPGPGYTAIGIGPITEGDIDYYSVTAPAGTSSLNLSLVPTGFSGVLRLYAANGAGLQTINNAGSGGTETLTNFAVTAGSTYYIGVSGDSIGGTGSYVLNVDFNPDDRGHPPASVAPGSGTHLRLNPFGDVSQGASIDTRSEVDLYRFYAGTAGSHVISVADTGVDILFRVYGADGQPISPTVDAFFPNQTETTTVNLASAGWVYVAVSGYESETGNYTVSVNGPSATATAVATPGVEYTGSSAGTISQAGEQDYFVLTAPAGTNLLNLNLVPGGGVDTQFVVYSSAGAELGFFDSGVGTDLAELAVVAGSSYYVGVRVAGDGGTGSYTLSADFNPDDPGDPPASVVPGTQGSTLQPNVLGDGGIVNGIFSRSANQLYGVRVDNPGSFTFTMEGFQSTVDTMLRVYGSNGQPLTPIINAQGTGVAESVTVTLPAGFAYVSAALAGGDTGSYIITMNGPSYPATVITLAQPAYTANLSEAVSTLQAKFWAVTAPVGATSLTLSASASITGLSGSVALFGSDGSSLVEILVNLPESESDIPVVAGQQYYVRVLNASNANDALVTFNLDFNPDANSPPTAANAPASAIEDTVFNGTLPLATDANSDPITYALGSAASNGTAVVNTNGSYSYTPNADFNGSDSFGFSVSDGMGGSNSYTVSVTVAAVNDAPVVANALTAQSATVGTALSFTFPANTFSDVDSATLTYSATLAGGGALPAWLSFDAATRAFTGTPAAGNVGTVTVSVAANDGALSASSSFALQINADVSGDPPDSVQPGTGRLMRPDLNGDNRLPQTISSASDNKLFAVKVDVPGPFTFTTQSAADSMLRVYGSDGLPLTPIINAQSTTANETVTLDLPAGFAYVNVALAGSATGQVFLRMDGPTVATQAVSLAQPGSTFSTSLTLLPAQFMVWSFTAPAGATQLNWDGAISPASTFIELYGADRASSIEVKNSSEGPKVTPVEAGATYFIAIQNPSLTSTAGFNFSLDLNPDPNRAPVAANGTTSATEDTVFNGNLPAATDADGDTTTYSLGSAAANGTAVVNTNGSYSYTPNANFNGSDSFGFSVADGKGGSNSYTVSVTVAAVNDAPVVANALSGQSATSGTAFGFTVPANTFSDVDNTTLTYAATLAGGGALPAWLSFDAATRAFSGTPAVGNVGTVTVNVVASDGSLTAGSSFALVVNLAANNAPVAANTSAAATEDTVLNGTLPAATDADADPITYALGTAAANGTAVVNTNGSYSYTPTANFNGSDSFGFSVSDGKGGSNSYAVSVSVAAVNDAPVVANALSGQSATSGTAFGFTVPANTFSDVDNTTLTYAATLAGGGALPAWLSFDAATRAFSGTPAAGNVGTVTVNVVASDGSLTAASNFALTVASAANGAPVAANTSANATEDTVFNGTLPAATDINSDPITYALGTAAANGTAVVNTNGSYSYTPTANFNGNDSFGFSVSDGKGGSNSYTVSVSVAALNDAPVVANALSGQSATSGTAFGFTVPANTFSDVDNTTLTYSATLAGGAALPAWLSFDAATRAFSGTPAAGNVGTVTVNVVASDGSLTASSSFALVVNGPAENRAPVSSNGVGNASEDAVLNGTLPAATDADGDPISYAAVGGAANGTLVVSSNGSYSYTARANFNGSDEFVFRVADNKGLSNLYTMSIVVAPVNDAPTGAVLVSGSPLSGQLLSADTSGIADVDGLGGLSYQWLRGGSAIAGATLSGYVPGSADLNSRISVRVSWVDGGGTAEALTSAPTAAVTQPNAPPTGSVVISGTTRIFETLSASHTLADADGLGTVNYQWLRDGAPIAGATGNQLLLLPADAGASITVRASYTDGIGNVEVVFSTASNAVAGFQPQPGTAASDILTGSPRPDDINGLAGNDTINAGDGRDSLRGGEGDDVLDGGAGIDTIDGGPGIDIVSYPGSSFVTIDLQAQRATRGGETDLLVGIEAFFGSSGIDSFAGAEAAANQRSDTVRGGAGDDVLDGRSGNDTAEYTGVRAGYVVQRNGDLVTVRDSTVANGDEGTDTLLNFERVVFADKLLAFGTRAAEIARVAFVLWTPDIVGSTTLFARGLSYYDVGYDFATMCGAALDFWSQQGLDFAQLLRRGAPGTTKTDAELLAIMARAGGGEAGRVAALTEMAFDAATTAQLSLRGVLVNGVVADLSVEGFGPLFGLLPGG